MTPPAPLTSPLYAALAALISAVLDGVTIFGVFPLSADQKAILLTIFSTAFVVAMLLASAFQHSNDRAVLRLRSADPAVRAQETRRL